VAATEAISSFLHEGSRREEQIQELRRKQQQLMEEREKTEQQRSAVFHQLEKLEGELRVLQERESRFKEQLQENGRRVRQLEESAGRLSLARSSCKGSSGIGRRPPGRSRRLWRGCRPGWSVLKTTGCWWKWRPSRSACSRSAPARRRWRPPSRSFPSSWSGWNPAGRRWRRRLRSSGSNWRRRKAAAGTPAGACLRPGRSGGGRKGQGEGRTGKSGPGGRAEPPFKPGTAVARRVARR